MLFFPMRLTLPQMYNDTHNAQAIAKTRWSNQFWKSPEQRKGKQRSTAQAPLMKKISQQAMSVRERGVLSMQLDLLTKHNRFNAPDAATLTYSFSEQKI